MVKVTTFDYRRKHRPVSKLNRYTVLMAVTAKLDLNHWTMCSVLTQGLSTCVFADDIFKHWHRLQSAGSHNNALSTLSVIHRQHSPPSLQCSRWCVFSPDDRLLEECPSAVDECPSMEFDSNSLLDVSEPITFLPSELFTRLNTLLVRWHNWLVTLWLSQVRILRVDGLDVAGSAPQSFEWDTQTEGLQPSSPLPASVAWSGTSSKPVTTVPLFFTSVLRGLWRRIQYDTGAQRGRDSAALRPVKARRLFAVFAAVELRVTRLQRHTTKSQQIQMKHCSVCMRLHSMTVSGVFI